MKRLIYLGACCFGSWLFVIGLAVISIGARNKENNFIRLLPSHLVSPEKIMDLKTSGRYIAGVRSNSVYLANQNSLSSILKLDTALTDSLSLKVTLPSNEKLYKGAFLLIGENSINILDGNQPKILTSKDINFTFKSFKSPYFTGAINTSKNSFIFRIITKSGNRLAKYRMDLAQFEESGNLLEKQVDGIFCTDGNLIKVPNSDRMIYIYYYRNQFICADSNLNPIYKGKTIDTVSRAKIKVSYISSQNETTLASPPLYVNKQSAANEKYLFIHSGLKADNEAEGTLNNLSVIDVYDINNGVYKFSFYLPDFSGKRLTDFKVYGQSLYALHDHYLYKYQLNF